MFGGPEETRTLDLSDANRTLSQLSYRPMGYLHIIARWEKIVKKKLAGFSNPWYTSRDRISDHLFHTTQRLQRSSKHEIDPRNSGRGIGSEAGICSECGEPHGRGQHHSLYRPLPQGNARRHGRHDAAESGDPPDLSAQPSGAPGRGKKVHRKSGQADAGAVRRHRQRRHHGGGGRPVPPLQAETPHPRLHRPGKRACASGRGHFRSGRTRPRRAGRGLYRSGKGCQFRRRSLTGCQ